MSSPATREAAVCSTLSFPLTDPASLAAKFNSAAAVRPRQRALTKHDGAGLAVLEELALPVHQLL